MTTLPVTPLGGRARLHAYQLLADCTGLEPSWLNVRQLPVSDIDNDILTIPFYVLIPSMDEPPRLGQWLNLEKVHELSESHRSIIKSFCEANHEMA